MTQEKTQVRRAPTVRSPRAPHTRARPRDRDDATQGEEGKKVEKIRVPLRPRRLRADFVDDKDTDAYRAFHMSAWARASWRSRAMTSTTHGRANDGDTHGAGDKITALGARGGAERKSGVRGHERYRAGAEKTFPFAQEFTTLNNITKHSVVRGRSR